MRLSIVLSALFIAVLFSSCRQKLCLSYGIEGLNISRKNGMVITDTSITLTRYTKDNTFSHAVDSVTRSTSIYAPPYEYTAQLDTPYMRNYNYDYKFTLHPSGTMIKFTHLTHDEGSGSSTMTCVNSVHYEVDGVPQKIEGYLGMQGFVLAITY